MRRCVKSSVEFLTGEPAARRARTVSVVTPTIASNHRPRRARCALGVNGRATVEKWPQASHWNQLSIGWCRLMYASKTSRELPHRVHPGGNTTIRRMANDTQHERLKARGVLFKDESMGQIRKTARRKRIGKGIYRDAYGISAADQAALTDAN